jgi:signal transduction histidine kinase
MRQEEAERATPLNLATVASEFRKIISSVVKEKARIIFELDDDLWPILATREQIENALLNLIINARDSIDISGDIRIATRNKRGEVGKVSAGTAPVMRDYVVLSVADTGCGMTPDIIDKIFEPFFSTKAKECGTGLGLTTVARFVHKQGGHIVVESEVGRGTDIQLWLLRHHPARGPSYTAPSLSG